ncbi:MAG: hypothetical protein FH757_09215 [Alcanivorax sp.]|nr:hypothetical protein [Alcanivorax sp.]
MRNLLYKIKKRFYSVKYNDLLKSVSVLVGGTAFSQLIAVASLPVLTRLYQPHDFSLLAVYTAALGIISVVSCLRLDVAIPLPEDDKDAASLLLLALLCSAFIGATLLIATIFWSSELSYVLRQPSFEPYIWLLPLGIWFASSYSAVQFWTARKKRFSQVARTRIVQASSGTGTQIGAGIINVGPGGLLFGQLILNGAGVFALAREIVRKDFRFFSRIRLADLRRLFVEYDKFPKYSMPEALANAAAIHLPMIIIAALTLGAEAGYLFLAMRLMSAPMTLIGGAVAQVYLSHAPDKYRDGELGDFTADIVGGLLNVGLGPIAFIGICAPAIFPIVFGEEWQRAGELVMWMVPWMALQFVASPISMSMHIRGWQRGMLALTVLGLALRLIFILIASQFYEPYMSEFYIASGAIFYGLCCAVFLKSSNVKSEVFLKKIYVSSLYTSLWVFPAIVLVVIL